MSILNVSTFQQGATERIYMGRPTSEVLREEVDLLQAKRVFLLVSESLRSNTDEIAKIEQALGSRVASVFSGIPPHAPRSSVLAASAAACEVNADLIIAIGGGSVTDAGKLIPLALKYNLREHDDLEALGSLKSDYFSDGVSGSALRLLYEALPAVQADPNDLDARLRCQVGSWQSMVPIVAGVPMGASHAIGHTLGGSYDVPHGHCSCVMAPAVLRFNETVNRHRQEHISACFGRPGESAADLVDEFIRSLGMPRTLAEVGVHDDQLDHIAALTMGDFWSRTNPRPIEGSADIRQILEMAR